MSESPKISGFGCLLLASSVGMAILVWRTIDHFLGSLAVWIEPFHDLGFKAYYRDRHIEFCKGCGEIGDSDGNYGYACNKCVPFIPLSDPDTGFLDENPIVSLEHLDSDLRAIRFDGTIEMCYNCNDDLGCVVCLPADIHEGAM